MHLVPRSLVVASYSGSGAIWLLCPQSQLWLPIGSRLGQGALRRSADARPAARRGLRLRAVRGRGGAAPSERQVPHRHQEQKLHPRQSRGLEQCAHVRSDPR